MSERLSNNRASVWWAVSLVGLIAGILVLAGAAAMLQGSGNAAALNTDVTVSKSDTAQLGSGSGSLQVEWWIQIVNTSQTAQSLQLSDTFQPGTTGTQISGYGITGGPIAVGPCAQTATQLNCDVIIQPTTTAFIVVRTTIASDTCSPQTVTNGLVVTEGGLNVNGSPDNGNIFIFDGDPTLCAPDTATFQLCKVWHPQGVIASNRSFTFNVSDTSQTQQVTISSVAENNSPVCVAVTAATGPVEVTESVPSGFDTPQWSLNGGVESDSGTGASEGFFLEAETCTPALHSLTAAIVADVIAENDCIVTFINEDNDTPPSPSPSTSPTPFDPPCPRCNTPAVPTATNTPVPPPATATNTPFTPPQPTATPTTGSGSTTLTDENRTQTAIAAAKTAAAQFTPIAPRTGDGAGAGSGNGALNLAFAVAGMVTLGAGLSLIAARRRR